MALGNSEKIGEAFVEVRADLSQMKKDFNKLKSNAGRTTKKVEGQFKKMTNGIKSSFASTLVSLFAVKKAWDFTIQVKNAKRDADETRSKFNTVFESIKDQANSTADAFSKAFGVAGTTSRKLLGDTGDLLVGFGFTEKAALEMSKEVNSLAQDLASFTNFSGGAEGASAALTKALLGETESAKSLGIVIRQNTKEFRDEVAEIVRTTGATSQQAKAQVILAQAYKQSDKAVGDYARTSDSLANVERRLDEQLKETAETLGTVLAPAFTSLFSMLIPLIKDQTRRFKEFFGIIDQGVRGARVAEWEEIFKSFPTSELKQEIQIIEKELEELQSEATVGGTLHSLLGIDTEQFKKDRAEIDLLEDQLKAIQNLVKGVDVDPPPKVVPEVKAQIKTIGDLERAIIALDGQIAKTNITDLEQIRIIGLKKDALQGQLDLIRMILSGESEITGEEVKGKLPSQDEGLTQTTPKVLETVEGVEKLEIAIEDTNAAMEILGDVSITTLGGMASMLSREVELFKDANTFAEKLLNNIVQLGLQAATLRLIGGFATGGIGGSGLLGFIGSSLGIGGAQFGGNFSAGGSAVTKMADGGNLKVPLGFGNDTFPMLLNSGETAEIKNAGQLVKSDQILQSVANSIKSLEGAVANNSNTNVNINANIDGLTFTEELTNPSQERLSNEASYDV